MLESCPPPPKPTPPLKSKQPSPPASDTLLPFHVLLLLSTRFGTPLKYAVPLLPEHSFPLPPSVNLDHAPVPALSMLPSPALALVPQLPPRLLLLALAASLDLAIWRHMLEAPTLDV